MTENTKGNITEETERNAKNEDRNHKDKLFRLIFGGEDKNWTLSLYNDYCHLEKALEGDCVEKDYI